MAELLRVARARRAQVRDAWERMAVQTSYLLAPWCKTPLTPAEILGERKTSPEEAEAILSELVEGTPAAVAEFDRFMAAQKAIRANR